MCDVFDNFPVIDDGKIVTGSSGDNEKVNTHAECDVKNSESVAKNADVVQNTNLTGSDYVEMDECSAFVSDTNDFNSKSVANDVESVANDADADSENVKSDDVVICHDNDIISPDYPDSSLDVDISPIHARFIDYYLVCGNKAKAAKLAGISAESAAALRVKACRLFNRDDVKVYYKLRKSELKEKADISFESFFSEIVSIATFDIKDAVETEVVNTLTADTVYSVHFKNIEDIPVYARKAVKSIEIAKDGTPKMVFYDKLAALKMIGEIKGYMKSSADGDEEETGVVLIPDVDFESESQGVQ